MSFNMNTKESTIPRSISVTLLKTKDEKKKFKSQSNVLDTLHSGEQS